MKLRDLLMSYEMDCPVITTSRLYVAHYFRESHMYSTRRSWSIDFIIHELLLIHRKRRKRGIKCHHDVRLQRVTRR